MRIVKNPELAGEVLQEGYVKIWNRAGDFRPDQARPMTWMAAIVRHQAIDLLRRNARQPRQTEPLEEWYGLADDARGPEEAAALEEQAAALHHCLGRLEREPRQAVLLAYFEGLTREELAERLNVPSGTVKSWLRRSLPRLRQCLEQS